MGAQSGKRVQGLSYIRAISCVAIIVIHTVYSAIALYPQSLPGNQVWIYRAVLNCLMWAVPCFVMVTGALLLDANRVLTYRKLFQKYIARIVAAAVFWGVIFVICEMTIEQQGSGLGYFLTGVGEIFTGKSWSHMWYLYCLIGLYLLLPAYKKVAAASSLADLEYLLVIYFLFLSALPVLKLWKIDCGFYIHVSTIYPFYLFCGYAIRRGMFRGKAGISFLLFAASTGILTMLTWLRWNDGMENLEMFFSYSSMFVVVQAIGMFLFLVQARIGQLPVLPKVLLAIDKNSFGIYLVHMIFVRALFKRLQVNPFALGAWSFLCIVLGIFLISYVVIWVMKKIPLLNRIL